MRLRRTSRTNRAGRHRQGLPNLACHVHAATALARTSERGDTAVSSKRAVSAAVNEVAEFLGNTPALARSSHVDPRVIDAHRSGQTISLPQRGFPDPGVPQAALERATLKLLREG